jgi:hypothetical protein
MPFIKCSFKHGKAQCVEIYIRYCVKWEHGRYANSVHSVFWDAFDLGIDFSNTKRNIKKLLWAIYFILLQSYSLFFGC